MATFLDIGLLKHITNVFIFLLVFAIMFGLLEYKKILGKDKKSLHGIIAFGITATWVTIHSTSIAGAGLVILSF